MMNLIKMDLYRMFRSRAIKIALIAAAIVCAASMLLSFGVIKITEFALQEDPLAAEGFSMIFKVVGWINGTNFSEIVLYGSGAFSLFIGCMLTASFIGAEQSCGYIKNIAGQFSNRGYTAISKFVVTSIGQLIIFLIYIAISSILAVTVFSEYINGYSIAPLVFSLILRLLLFWAVNAIILFLCTLTKSHALAMVTGAVFGSGVTGLVYFAANTLLGAMKVKLNVSHFTPDGVNGMLSIADLKDVWVRALIIAVIFIVVFLGSTVMLVKKRDVR